MRAEKGAVGVETQQVLYSGTTIEVSCTVFRGFNPNVLIPYRILVHFGLQVQVFVTSTFPVSACIILPGVISGRRAWKRARPSPRRDPTAADSNFPRSRVLPSNEAALSRVGEEAFYCNYQL